MCSRVDILENLKMNFLCCVAGKSRGSASSENSVGSATANSAMPQEKKKFGGSLRRLFHRKRRSTSASKSPVDQPTNLLSDLDRSFDHDYDRLSIERDDPNARSSPEKEITPPHHRVLSASNSAYSYNEAVRGVREPRLSRYEMQQANLLEQNRSDILNDEQFDMEDRRHFSLPSSHRQLTSM